MAAAAGNSGLLEDLELSFSLRKEQRTAQKSFLKKENVFGILPTGYGKSLISTSFATSFVALPGCSAILLRAEGI